MRPPAMFAAVVMVCAVGGVLFSPLLDKIQVEASRCEVVSAEPRTSSGGSRGSASSASVLIETSNLRSPRREQGRDIR